MLSKRFFLIPSTFHQLAFYYKGFPFSPVYTRAFVCICIYVDMSVYTLSLYSVDYNPCCHYLFWWSHCPRFGQWTPLQTGRCVPCSVPLFLLSSFLTKLFPASTKSAISLGSPGVCFFFFLFVFWRMIFTNEDLRVFRVLGFWASTSWSLTFCEKTMWEKVLETWSYLAHYLKIIAEFTSFKHKQQEMISVKSH